MTRRLYLLALPLGLLLCAPAFAQSLVVLDVTADTPNGPSPTGGGVESVFRVDNAGGFVATGTLGIGRILAQGSGERLLWHPYKGAFRAGSIGAGNQNWDDNNVGFYTWAGGYNTLATGLASFAMGYNSLATGSYSLAIGNQNTATGTGSIALGYRSTANASYGVAIGQRASVDGYTGAIVFSDASTTNVTEATAQNQFTVRAAGGTRIFTNSSMIAGVSLSPGGSSWNVVSDSTRKTDVAALDGEDVLGRLARLPVSTWRYKAEADRDGQPVRHVGPMAQDWQRLVAGPLGLNADSTVINQGDLDGVSLAAAKALEARTSALQAENEALRARLDALEAEVRQHHPLERAAGLLGGFALLAVGLGWVAVRRRAA